MILFSKTLFQRDAEIVPVIFWNLKKMNRIKVIIGDKLIHGKNMHEHDIRIKEALNRLKHVGIKLNV